MENKLPKYRDDQLLLVYGIHLLRFLVVLPTDSKAA